MAKIEIIPTDFAYTLHEFEQRLAVLVPLVKQIHIDLMDGAFVDAVSPHLSAFPDLQRYKRVFEAHLMVKEPRTYLTDLKEKGFNKVIFHVESCKHARAVRETIATIKKLEMQVFVALNPETSLDMIEPFASEIDGMLIMGVHPGREGQEFIEGEYYKIKAIKERWPSLAIQIDGGVNAHNIAKLASFGATLFNVGSFVSRAPDPKKALGDLYRLVKDLKKS